MGLRSFRSSTKPRVPCSRSANVEATSPATLRVVPSVPRTPTAVVTPPRLSSLRLHLRHARRRTGFAAAAGDVDVGIDQAGDQTRPAEVDDLAQASSKRGGSASMASTVAPPTRRGTAHASGAEHLGVSEQGERRRRTRPRPLVEVRPKSDAEDTQPTLPQENIRAAILMTSPPPSTELSCARPSPRLIPLCFCRVG